MGSAVCCESEENVRIMHFVTGGGSHYQIYVADDPRNAQACIVHVERLGDECLSREGIERGGVRRLDEPGTGNPCAHLQGPDEPPDRRKAVHKPFDGQVPPSEHVRENRGQEQGHAGQQVLRRRALGCRVVGQAAFLAERVPAAPPSPRALPDAGATCVCGRRSCCQGAPGGGLRALAVKPGGVATRCPAPGFRRPPAPYATGNSGRITYITMNDQMMQTVKMLTWMSAITW